MSAELTPLRASPVSIYDRTRDASAFLKEVGAAIFSSRMFGCETQAQGQVLALECAARRMPPLALAERYHLIKGKLSMKAEAMLADFSTVAGGTYDVIARMPDRAAIKMTRNRKSQVFELTWEEAAKEPFVYHGKEEDCVAALAAGQAAKLKVKPKYATPRSRMQMLWARVVSDAVRTMAPEVLAGHYTPEEVSDFTGEPLPDDPPAEENVVDVEAEDAEDQRREAERKAEGQRLADSQPAEHRMAGQPPASSANGKATAEQVAQVKSLVTELGVDREKLVAILARAKAAKVSDLSAEHCQILIEKMQAEKAKREGN